MNISSEAFLANINPSLADKIRQMAAVLAGRGITVIATAGVRTWAEQDTLYAQGRTTPGKIVTNAQGGYSWHNFGCAVDCAPEVIDGQIDWNASHPQWKLMEEVGVSLGLVSGANWLRLQDAPHFQLTGRFPVSPDDEARQIFTDQGTQEFWNEVNATPLA
jgi:peptidoglycan L-alanyl-D-glutamate endopeptidase CwlK